MMRNERRYVREWLAFHAAAGVEHFYIYDNNSDDGMAEEIMRFSRPDMITLSPWTIPPPKGHRAAYWDAFSRWGADSRWMAFIDGDEFLFSTEKTDLREFLKGFEHRSALAVHWMIYGSSDHEKRPSGLQIESYLRRGEVGHMGNQHIKSVVQTRFGFKPQNSHVWALKSGDIVREDDEPITGTTGATGLRAKSERIRINHYFTRSWEDWEAKVARGRSTSREQLRLEQFEKNNRNEVHDDAALKFRPLMERFLNPSLADRIKAALYWRPLARLRYARRRRWVASHPNPSPMPRDPKPAKQPAA